MAETDAELTDHYLRLRELAVSAEKRRDRMPPGGARDRRSRYAGGLVFALLGVRQEMCDRRVPIPEPMIG